VETALVQSRAVKGESRAQAVAGRALAVAVVLVLTTIAAAPGARAQDPRATARARLVEGAALFDKGDYAGALAKFNEAHRTFPSARILFNIGQAERELGHAVQALRAFEQFLTEVPDAAPETAAEAREAVSALTARVATLQVEADVAGAAIEVDGEAFGATPRNGPIRVAPGSRAIKVNKPGHEPFTDRVDAEAGVTYRIRARLPVVPAAAAPAPVVVPPPAPARTPAPEPIVVSTTAPPAAAPAADGPWRTVGVVLLTGAGISLVGGITAIKLGRDRAGDVENDCNDGNGCTWGDSHRLAEDSGRRYQTLTYVGFGVGAALAVGGGLCLLLPRRTEPQVSLHLGPSSVGLRGRW
jgi:hypothetical protein